MKAIIAVNNLGYIGFENGLPWKSSEDLKHFKNLTQNSTLLVGYNTKQTLPELKNRTLIVDERENCLNTDNISWCIGGKKTYEKYCHLFEEIHISFIDNNTIGDVRFPDLKNLNKNCKVYRYFF